MRFTQFSLLAAALLGAAAGSPTVKHEGHRLAFRTQSAPSAANSSAPTGGGQQTVVVQQGQTLGAIATQFGTGICDIAKASNLKDPNLISVGQTLVIPPPTATPDNTSCLPPAPPAAVQQCVVGGPDRLVIPTAGLTVELAAKFLNITQGAFTAANSAAAVAGNSTKGALTAASVLAGSSIVSVPVCPNSQCTISQATIKQGDIFDKVAAAAGSTTGQILALNPGIDRLNLQIGQKFTLPSDCKNVTANAGKGGGANKEGV